jgi:hypothetical protein
MFIRYISGRIVYAEEEKKEGRKRGRKQEKRE